MEVTKKKKGQGKFVVKCLLYVVDTTAKHVVERTRMNASGCTKIKNTRTKTPKLLFFIAVYAKL